MSAFSRPRYFFISPRGFIPEIFSLCLEEQAKPGNTLSGPDIYNKIAEQNDDVVNIIGAGDVHMYELQPSSARWRAKENWLEVRPTLPSFTPGPWPI